VEPIERREWLDDGFGSVTVVSTIEDHTAVPFEHVEFRSRQLDIMKCRRSRVSIPTTISTEAGVVSGQR
jgi:hypothetical protein